MALDTYANLKSALADWLNRADLTAAIPDFTLRATAPPIAAGMQIRLDIAPFYATQDAAVPQHGHAGCVAALDAGHLDAEGVEPVSDPCFEFRIGGIL